MPLPNIALEVNTLIRERLRQLKPSVKQAIAPTILATLIFFLMYFFFGSENTMIGPIVTLPSLPLMSRNSSKKF